MGNSESEAVEGLSVCICKRLHKRQAVTVEEHHDTLNDANDRQHSFDTYADKCPYIRKHHASAFSQIWKQKIPKMGQN